MSRYKTVFDDSQVSVLSSLANCISDYETRLLSIANGIDTRDGSLASLQRQIRAAAATLPPIAGRVRGESSVWRQLVTLYKRAETDATHALSSIRQRLAESWSVESNFKDSTLPSLWDAVLGREKIEDTESWMRITNGAFVLSLLNTASFLEATSGKGTIKKVDLKDSAKKADPKDLKEKGGISVYGIGGGIVYSLLEARYDGEYGSVSAKTGNAEAHWSADAGMYMYNKDGGKFWSPRIAAEVGASATVLTVAANGALQITGKDTATTLDDFGFQGKVEGNAGKVEGKIEAKSILFDKNGNFKPEAKISGSIEAIAAEAKGSAGVTVAGVEANVTGKVGIGVGAHADVGLADGKFKVEIGAYLGVGGSVGFEIDIGGAVDAVCKSAQAAWDWFKFW